MRRFRLRRLKHEIRAAIAEGLTPLVLDASDDHVVDTFFSYSADAIVLDAKKMSLDATLRKQPDRAALDAARKRVVLAMKNGSQLVVATQQAAVDFVYRLGDWSFFAWSILARAVSNVCVTRLPNVRQTFRRNIADALLILRRLRLSFIAAPWTRHALFEHCGAGDDAPTRPALADVDGDGDLDLLVSLEVRARARVCTDLFRVG